MSDAASIELRFQIHTKGTNFSEPRALSHSGRLPRITQVLALAIHLAEMIQNGEATDYADLARLGGLSRERISQIMRLNYLVPDIQVEILYLPPTATGRYPISETSVRTVASLLSWTEQRERWRSLKQSSALS